MQRASEVLPARVWDQHPTLLIACSIYVSRFAGKDDERTVELADQSEQKEMHSHNGVGYAPLAISRLSWVRARFCKRETCICEMLSCFATSA